MKIRDKAHCFLMIVYFAEIPVIRGKHTLLVICLNASRGATFAKYVAQLDHCQKTKIKQQELSQMARALKERQCMQKGQAQYVNVWGSTGWGIETWGCKFFLIGF